MSCGCSGVKTPLAFSAKRVTDRESRDESRSAQHPELLRKRFQGGNALKKVEMTRSPVNQQEKHQCGKIRSGGTVEDH